MRKEFDTALRKKLFRHIETNYREDDWNSKNTPKWFVQAGALIRTWNFKLEHGEGLKSYNQLQKLLREELNIKIPSFRTLWGLKLK